MLNRNNKFFVFEKWFYGRLVVGAFLLVLLQTGCKKLVDTRPPVTSINSANVFSNDATAAAVFTGIYTNMSLSNSGLYGIADMFLFLSLSADELTLYDINNTNLLPYYTNGLTNLNTGASDYWQAIYPIIYITNLGVEGLNSGSGLTPAVKQQLIGEAKFIRAFCYFYLVNLYGDVPLVTGTDYTLNDVLPRTPKAQIWQQIIRDLKDAQSLLGNNYLDATLLNTTMERVRPTSWSATALLARTYLYTQKWDSAEAQATAVINNSTLYSLDTLNGVFLKNNPEAIWQLQPVGSDINSNTGEGALFNLPATGPNTSGMYPVYLSNYVVNSFEPGDLRRINWVDSVTVGNTTYYYPYKYKIGLVNTPTAEYSTVFRLGEQYLIRAEARAEQNNIPGADSDLDVIRTRAGLPGYAATDQVNLLTTIQHERQVELFTEWGHRWLDIKRTGAADAVMGTPGGVCAAKGGSWNTSWQWYPLPLSEFKADPQLKQNQGYQ